MWSTKHKTLYLHTVLYILRHTRIIVRTLIPVVCSPERLHYVQRRLVW